MFLNKAQKPKDWGKNDREVLLTLVSNFCDDFIKTPTYINKERLIAITTFDEPSRHENMGLIRFTDYECELINNIYDRFSLIHFLYGINFLYDLLFRSAQLMKLINMIPGNTIDTSQWGKELLPNLKYFFWTCYYFHQEKQRSFADELINEISIIEKTEVISKEEVAFIFNSVLFDLSGKCNNHVFKDFDFSRKEIFKLLSKSSDLMKKANIKQVDIRYKSSLSIVLTNFILRSRNNYNFENIYKCVSKPTINSSFRNNELWMRKRSKLNDKREGRVIREIFANRKWIKYEWAKTMKFTFERDSFTCSFSTKNPSEKQRSVYGEYVYGYNNDIVGPSISTLIKKKNINTGVEIAAFSQYIMYDVLYSRVEFKKEMNYLFSIIDTFNISDEEKKFFLEEIIDYWKMTIKDKRWEYENERRYEIMHYDSYVYTECNVDDVFLKNKSLILLYPDFIIGDNSMKLMIRNNIIEKASYKNLGSSSVICENCLHVSSLSDREKGCVICKSKSLTTINCKKE